MFLSQLARRHDPVTAQIMKTRSVGDTEKLRGCGEFERQLCTVAGVSTSGEWNLLMNQTRVGSAVGSSVPKGKQRAVKFEQDVLKRNMERARAGTSDSTLGLVVGDLNLTYDQVRYVLENAACDARARACLAAEVPAQF